MTYYTGFFQVLKKSKTQHTKNVKKRVTVHKSAKCVKTKNKNKTKNAYIQEPPTLLTDLDKSTDTERNLF